MFTKAVREKSNAYRKANKKSFAVKYARVSRRLERGFPLGDLDLATRTEHEDGPFLSEMNTEKRVLALMVQHDVIPGSIEVVEFNNGKHVVPPSPHLGQLVLTGEAIL